MKLECKSLEPGPLQEKGIGGIVDCKITEAKERVEHLSDAYNIVNVSMKSLGVNANIVFTENENIGDRFMIYKFHVIEDNISLASIRLVIDRYIPIRLIITIDKMAIGLRGAV